MKHKIIVLGLVISCLLGLTACGSEAKLNTVEGSRYNPGMFTTDSLLGYSQAIEDGFFEQWFLSGVTPENFEEKLYFTVGSEIGDDAFDVFKSGYESWFKAVKDVGYNSADTLQNDLSVTEVEYYVNDEGELVVDSTLQGTKHSAVFEIYLSKDGQPTDMGVTVNKTFGEKLENAGLNTLLGMGMAFTILIIISLIISLFPIIFGGGKKKKESDKEITEKAMDNTISQIAEQEDLSSDAELVAVIAAAIAAYEGSGSTDGFRVRSIRRVNTNWRK